MTKTSTDKKYTYNLKYEEKEEWFAPTFWQQRQHSNALFKNYAYKDDDVIVCTYPRSGTHMTWMLIRYIVQGTTEPIKDAMEDSYIPPLKRPDNDQVGRRVLNTHSFPADFGDDIFMNGKHKFIYVIRNPKDVLVSLSHMADRFGHTMPVCPRTWEEWVPFSVTNDIPMMNWFTHARAWEEFMEKNPDAPVLGMKFEEIVRHPETSIRKMAKFLEVPLSDTFLQDIVVASKFEKMKDAPVSEQFEALHGDEVAKNLIFYRKGKIGDWMNTFTVAQNEMFDSAYEEKMKGSKVTNIYR